MKRYILSLAVAAACLTGYAESFWGTFIINNNNEQQETSAQFDWVEKGKTCQWAAAAEGTVKVVTNEDGTLEISGQGPNAGARWKVQKSAGNFPSEVKAPGYDNPIQVIGVGEFSFATEPVTNDWSWETVFPETYQYLGKGAFAGQKLYMQTSLKNFTRFEDYVFLNNKFDQLFDIENAEYIGDYAFYGATNAVFPVDLSKAKHIGKGAFQNCTLSALTLGTCEIENDAFYMPTTGSFSSLTIKGDIAEISPSWLKLDEEKVGSFHSIEIAEGAHVGKISKDFKFMTKNLTSFIVNGTLDLIEERVFEGNTAGEQIDKDTNIKTVVLDGVREIGPYAFSESRAPGKLNLTNVTKIGEGAFYKCYDIEEVAFSDTFTKIPEKAFYEVKSLEKVTVNGVETIGEEAFAGCLKIAKLGIDKVQTIGKKAFCGAGVPADFVLPNSLTSMGESAFEGFYNLEKLTFGNGLKVIPLKAFYNGNSSLTEIIISDSVEEIGKYAFTRWNYADEQEHLDAVFSQDEKTLVGMPLKKLTIGQNVKIIDDYAFAECTDLEGLTIPDNVEIIGDYAFCHGWKTCPIVFGAKIREIGNYAFFCSGNWDANCGHSAIVLPSTLKTIGYGALTFNNTAEGGNFGNAGDQRNNGQVIDVYCYALNPPKIEVGKGKRKEASTGEIVDANIDTFGDYEFPYNGDDYWSDHSTWMYTFLCLHVPQGTYSLYEADEHWSLFKCIIDDLVPMTEYGEMESIQEFVDYVFLQIEPNVAELPTVNLSTEFGEKYLPSHQEGLSVDTWEIFDEKADDSNGLMESEILRLYKEEGGHWYAEGKKLGQQLVLAYDTHTNKAPGSQGGKEEAQKSLVGAVMIFVCPTITVVYDSEIPVKSDPTTPEEPLSLLATDDTGDSSSDENSSDYDKEIVSSASYQHRTIYNSYPKLEIVAPEGITIEKYEKGHYDEDGNYTKDYEEGLKDLDSNQQVGQGSEENGNYVVPVSSVTENRLIKLSLVANPTATEQTPTGITETKVSDEVTIRTLGRVMYIDGADENANVNIYALNGRLVMSTTDKTIEFNAPGIYIVKVDDTVFKASVR